MNPDRRRAVAALTAAGLLWGTTVPLSKLALEWLPPGWLTFARFGMAAAIRMPPAGPGLGRHRVWRVGHHAERRHHPNKRQPRGAADWRRTRAGRGRRGPLAPRRGAPDRMGGLRGVTRRRRSCHWRSWGRRDGWRRWPGAGVATTVGHVHRGAGPPAAWPRPDRGNRRAIPGRRRRRAAVHDGGGGHACARRRP